MASVAEKKIIQEVMGTILYYARAVGANMYLALRIVASQQSNPIENPMKKVTYFLGRIATHSNTIITYHVSDMVFVMYSIIHPTCQIKRLGAVQGDMCYVKQQHHPSKQ